MFRLSVLCFIIGLAVVVPAFGGMDFDTVSGAAVERAQLVFVTSLMACSILGLMGLVIRPNAEA